MPNGSLEFVGSLFVGVPKRGHDLLDVIFRDKALAPEGPLQTRRAVFRLTPEGVQVID